MLVRLTVLIAALTGPTASLSGEASPSPDTRPIHGSWVIAGLPPGVSLPKDCTNIGFDITSTTITMRSAGLVVTASYKAESLGRGYRLKQAGFKHNGKANCQGIPADAVVANYIHNLDLELAGGHLRVYRPTRDSGVYSEYIRVAPSDATKRT